MPSRLMRSDQRSQRQNRSYPWWNISHCAHWVRVIYDGQLDDATTVWW